MTPAAYGRTWNAGLHGYRVIAQAQRPGLLHLLELASVLPYANICSHRHQTVKSHRSVPSGSSQGSELAVIRSVSKTENPGSNPGSPA